MTAFAVAALTLPVPFARAGVVYVNQTRQVVAETSHIEEPENSDSNAASDFAPFDGTARSELHDEEDGDGSEATVTQNSRLDASGISARGEFEVVALGEFGRGRSLVDVTFDVTDSPQNFAFRYDLAAAGGADAFGRAFNTAILLGRIDGSASTPVEGPLNIDLFPLGAAGEGQPTSAEGSASGTLETGRYRFLFDMRAFSVSFEDAYGASYDVALDLSEAGPGPGPTPIPLPPATWAALATMGGFGAVQRFRRRSSATSSL